MIMGIDPGLGGAIAMIYDDGAVYVEDMPVIEEKKGKRIRRSINPHGVAAILRDFMPTHLYIERVASRPGEGTVSSFNFGQGYGILLGVAAALNIPFTLVPPTEWKRGLKLTGDKGSSRRRASELYPQVADKFMRVKDDGRAEAVLIAHYGGTQ